jgi:hypothetical protein
MALDIERAHAVLAHVRQVHGLDGIGGATGGHPNYSLRLWSASHLSFVGGATVGTSSITRSAAMSGERRLDRQANEPSLTMSFVLLFVVLAAMVAIVANVNVPDVQLSTADLWDGLT